MNPTDRPLNSSTPALARQDRLNEWVRLAALCLIDGDRPLARLCLDELAAIRRETTVDWSDS